MSAAALIDDADAIAEVFADFPTFCELLDIRTKDGPPKQFGYDGWFDEQKAFERDRTGRDIVLKPRQVGFTTLELARDLWHAIVNPGHQVLVIVHLSEAADTLFQTIQIFCESLTAMGLLPKRKYSSKREVVFAAPLNSAVRIVESGATEQSAEKKGRSGTVHRLHATEVAFWGAAQATITAALSAVPKTGEVVVESTANGAGGWFYEHVVSAMSGRGRYKAHFYPWFEHAEYRLPANDNNFDPAPRDEWERKLRARGCTDEQIVFWRAEVDEKGLELALQEYPESAESCFRAAGNSWLDPISIDKLGSNTRAPIRTAPITWNGHRLGDALIYAEPVPGRQYVAFGDVAEGVARDADALCVMDAITAETVASFWSDSIEPGDFGCAMGVIGWLYNGATVCPERNNHGHAALRALKTELEYPSIYHAKDGKPGWDTNSVTRPVMWDELGHAIRDGSITTPDAETVAECRTLIRDEDGKPRARGKGKKSKDASRDDRFVAWAGAFQIRSSALSRRGSFRIPGL